MTTALCQRLSRQGSPDSRNSAGTVARWLKYAVPAPRCSPPSLVQSPRMVWGISSPCHRLGGLSRCQNAPGRDRCKAFRLGLRLRRPPSRWSGSAPALAPSISLGIETANQGGSPRRASCQEHQPAATSTPRSPSNSSPPSRLIRAIRACHGASLAVRCTCR